MYYKLLRNCCLLRWVHGKLNVNNFLPDLEIAHGVEVGAELVMGEDHPDQLQHADGVSQPVSRAENKNNLANCPEASQLQIELLPEMNCPVWPLRNLVVVAEPEFNIKCF